MEIILDYKSLYNINDIIKYQNNLLIRQIAQDYNWNLDELKPYIVNNIIEEKTVKENIISASKKIFLNNHSNSEESESEVKILKKKIIIKRKKPSKKEEGYTLIEYQQLEYYLDRKTNYVYRKLIDEEETGDFIGILEGKKINFDAEASE